LNVGFAGWDLPFDAAARCRAARRSASVRVTGSEERSSEARRETLGADADDRVNVASGEHGPGQLLLSGSRRALALFVVLETIALPLMMSWGHRLWFEVDDWDFLAARKVGDFGDLMRPHHGHWTTLPIIAYRLLWELVGLRSYTPYLALVVVAHLAVAALLRAVMRRSGVGPWLSTLGVAVFIFFGSGAENVLVAFQVTFVGSIAFGLGQLLLADHDGSLDPRDWLALLCGFAALLCSGIGLTMILIVGLATLIRRGWRVAVFHTAPLGMIFLTWLWLAPKGQTAAWKAGSIRVVLRFVAVGLETAFARLGELPGVGILLGLLSIVGFAMTYRSDGRKIFSGPAAAPFALLVGAIVFLVTTGLLRSGDAGVLARLAGTGSDRASRSRYIYVVGALVLPALVFGADRVIRRWPRMTVPLVALLAIGVPGNVGHFQSYKEPRYVPQARRSILAAARNPLANQLPRSLMPVPFFAIGVTIGWLLDSRASGRLPSAPSLTPNESANETLLLVLRSSRLRATSCRLLRKPMMLILRKGDALTAKLGVISIINVPLAGGRSFPRRLSNSATVAALAGPLRLLVAPVPIAGSQPAVVCT
jgi:hypothetical protein